MTQKRTDLDAAVERFYAQHARGKQINVMDIGKVFAEGRLAGMVAWAKCADPTTQLAAVEQAVIAAIATYCIS